MSFGRRAVFALAALVAAALAGVGGASIPAFPEVASPEAYGRVILDQASTKARVPAVVFDHWVHRALFSCRACHVDVGFAMQRGASGVSRASNAAGMHCGTCHNGRMLSRAKPVFEACSAEGEFDRATCGRCHAGARASSGRARYVQFARALPQYSGGYVDWEMSEAQRLIMPSDFVEGVSFERSRLKIDRDVAIEVKGTWLGSVTFSHKKHAVWNGCEVCHPEIFPNTKRGSAKFTMADVNDGKYCGVCHRTVAFPLAECKRCHAGGAAQPARRW